jgi:CubicO group peptidase (beta-lactamase class C family)
MLRFSLTFLLLGSALFAQSPDKLDALFAPLASAKTPGLAVMVRQNGKTIAQRAYGVRELLGAQSNDASTNFRLASFTKQFTAMSVMLLVHDGKLRYTQSLDELLPGFPAWARAITLRHLLTHTSGLPDYEDAMDSRRYSPGHQIQDEEVLALLQKQATPKFAAGARWDYSNSAYVLLGLIVAKASGMPFDKFLGQRIFNPLGMTATLMYRKGQESIVKRAYGYSKRAGAFVETDQSSTSATLGDGGIYSNLNDLAKWDDALRGHTLLSEMEMAPALLPATLASGAPALWPPTPGEDNLNPGKPVAYGFGWFLDPYRGHARMWHTGSTSGFRTVIERFPKDDLTVIVLCNRTDLDAAALALQAADFYLKPAN